MRLEAIRAAYVEKLEALKGLDLPEGQYLIWGSGPLAIRGLREGRDVDLVVTEKYWRQLIQKHPVEGEKKNRIDLGNVEIWSDLMNLTDIIDEMIANCDWFEGQPFMKLSYVVRWKKWLGREKDLRDVKVIKEYLAEM